MATAPGVTLTSIGHGALDELFASELARVGAWRLQAVERIREWLVAALPSASVLG